MKNKLLIIGTICLLIITFGFTVSAEQATTPPSTEGGQAPQMPQGQPPQVGRGQMPPENIGDMPADEATEQTTSIPTEETNTTQENSRENVQPADTENQLPETNTEGNMNQPGEFNPANMENFPFGQQGMETQQEPEKPYEKWITPIVSAVVMIFGFVFVALYKRKQY